MDVPYAKVSYGIRVAIALIAFIGLIMGIVGVASAEDPETWLGKWIDVPGGAKADPRDYVCTMAAPCPSQWKKLGTKCFRVGRKAFSRLAAENECKLLNSNANLAVIESAPEDKFAFDMCNTGMKADGCYMGLVGWGDTKKLANWKWVDASISSYRNWWVSDDHEEPTGGDDEESVSWITTPVLDGIKAFVLIQFITMLAGLVILIGCCSMNAAFMGCGFKNNNSCCIITASVLDGCMVALMLMGVAGAIRGPNIGQMIFNLILGGLFLTVSILGCCQCSAVKGPPGAGQMAPTAPGPQFLGQTVVGQVITGQPIEVIGGNPDNKVA